MALAFTDGSTNNIDHGSATPLDTLTTWTAIFWINWNTLTDFRQMMNKAVGLGRRRIEVDATDELTVRVARNSFANNCVYTTNNANLTTGKWWYIAVTFDTGASAGEVVNVYLGDISTLVTERTYATATDGSGAVDSEASASLFVGSAGGGGSNAVGADIAIFQFYDTALSVEAIQLLQWLPRVLNSNCLIYSHYGFNGTGTQADWSGNGNSGTVTGATVSDHVPLGPPFGFDVFFPVPSVVVGGVPLISHNHPARNVLLRM